MKEWKSDMIGLVSIGLSIMLLISEEYRLIAMIILGFTIILYTLNSFSSYIEKHEQSINKFNERLNIYNELINIKSDIKYLKKKVSIK